jgi:DNA recombination protein RmuC
MLKHPKIRGGFGEALLANLLADVLPHDRYQVQYTFPGTGDIVDAVIMLQDGFKVSVDAKFPLANYQLMVLADDPVQKKAIRRLFFRDIKKHIQDISSKYIVPQAKTLDYAFMYIPVEAVYYETMIHEHAEETLWEFCLSHKVIPVSPNSLLAYLQTVLIGLRGMKVEQQAKEILEHLGQIRQDFSQFSKDFSMIGNHLNNAKNRYDDSARRLDKFSNRLEHIESVGDRPLPPTPPSQSIES